MRSRESILSLKTIRFQSVRGDSAALEGNAWQLAYLNMGSQLHFPKDT
jgi:hypothetical protein